MPTPEEEKKHVQICNAFLAGESVFGIKFRHNSVVSFEDESGSRIEGWIIAIVAIEPEPTYTVECCDGSGDKQLVESKLTLVPDLPESS